LQKKYPCLSFQSVSSVFKNICGYTVGLSPGQASHRIPAQLVPLCGSRKPRPLSKQPNGRFVPRKCATIIGLLPFSLLSLILRAICPSFFRSFSLFYSVRLPHHRPVQPLGNACVIPIYFIYVPDMSRICPGYIPDISRIYIEAGYIRLIASLYPGNTCHCHGHSWLRQGG
jgi:hypothetical protein